MRHYVGQNQMPMKRCEINSFTEGSTPLAQVATLVSQ
jgi:hypothetical protein